MAVYEIPLLPQSQILNINVGGIYYNLYIFWRSTVYVMDIYDVNQNLIISGIPLIQGGNLLAQFTYLNIPGEWYIISDGTPYIDPTYYTLGQSTHLMVVV